MKSHLLYTKLISAAVAGAAFLGGTPSWGQSAPDQSAPAPDDQSAFSRDKSDVIVITGTRTEGRSVQDSPVPVDVLTAEAIEDISFTDTQDVLRTLVPSFTTARQPISDGATFIRPASLRGLSSDKTLVLVNSKRRHRAALVSTGGSGTQGPDVSTIPASALKAVEVLRDGAAAQYGSDAIAGVINFILKDSPEGGEIHFQAGTYYEDDGEDLLIAGNLGLPIGDKGFVNISVEGTTSQRTTRSQEWRTQAADPGNYGGQSSFDVPTFLAANPQYQYLFGSGEDFDTSNVQLWGQPEAEAFRSFINAGYQISETMEIYGFANYSNSVADGDFNYRNPTTGIHTNRIRQPDGTIFQFITNYPAGRTPRFDVTLDFYLINISDQFYAVSPITVDAATRAALLAAGVPGADTIGQVNFFQNAFDSETYGVDLVVSYLADWGDAGSTNFTASANYNGYQIESVNIQNQNGTDLFDAEAIYDFEHGQPKFRGVFTAMHEIGAWTFMGRANYYGSYKVSNCVPNNCTPAVLAAGATVFEVQKLAEEVLFDLEAEYAFSEDFSVAIGARNVFDEYPDVGEYRLRETSNGRIYRSDSVVDW